jgi:hypothetical protein
MESVAGHHVLVRKLPDRHHGPIVVTSSFGAWPSGTTQSREMVARVWDVEAAQVGK